MKKNMLISLLMISVFGVTKARQSEPDRFFTPAQEKAWEAALEYESIQRKAWEAALEYENIQSQQYAQDRVLLDAAYRGDIKIVEEALAKGANIYALDAYGHTAVFVAHAMKKLNMEEYLKFQQNVEEYLKSRQRKLPAKKVKNLKLLAQKRYDNIKLLAQKRLR